ncbi:MAG: antibiotic biosynthesis monooxygenase [Rhizobacter sp.]|nr:antibiotic biosynthesis monooxygenase [Chlorobiales bacterium]
MKKLGLLVTVKAKSGKENEVSKFLASAVDLARQEDKTLTWYAFQTDASTFGVFDTFETEEGRNAHLNGEIAKALMANAPTLLAEPPKIEKIDVLGSK